MGVGVGVCWIWLFAPIFKFFNPCYSTHLNLFFHSLFFTGVLQLQPIIYACGTIDVGISIFLIFRSQHSLHTYRPFFEKVYNLLIVSVRYLSENLSVPLYSTIALLLMLFFFLQSGGEFLRFCSHNWPNGRGSWHYVNGKKQCRRTDFIERLYWMPLAILFVLRKAKLQLRQIVWTFWSWR